MKVRPWIAWRAGEDPSRVPPFEVYGTDRDDASRAFEQATGEPAALLCAPDRPNGYEPPAGCWRSDNQYEDRSAADEEILALRRKPHTC
jgi:hypothetical protein